MISLANNMNKNKSLPPHGWESQNCLTNQKFCYVSWPYSRFNRYSTRFSKNDMHSLTFTRWWAPRPLFISFTSTGAVSITENVAPIAGIVGYWSNCGVRELHLTIYWMSQPATTNCNCKCVKNVYTLRCSQKVQSMQPHDTSNDLYSVKY